MPFDPSKPWESFSGEQPESGKPAPSETSGKFNPDKPWKSFQQPASIEGAGTRFVKAAKVAGGELVDEVAGAAKDTWAAVTKPLPFMQAFNEALGPVEAVGAATVGMGKMAAGGVTGAGNWIVEAMKGNASTEAFRKGKDQAEALLDKYIPSEPESNTGRAVLRTLGLAPEAIAKAGDVGYETTKSPAVGAGIQTLATYLTFGAPRPGVKAKPTRVAKAVDDAFGELVENHPEAAREVVNKVADEKVKLKLSERLDDIVIDKQKQVKDIFKDAKSRGPGAAAVSKSDVSEIFSKAKKEGTAAPKAEGLEVKDASMEEFEAARKAITPEQASATIRNSITKPTLEINGSAESSASLEALHRMAGEKSRGEGRYVINVDSQTIHPLIGPEAVDAKAYPGKVVVLRRRQPDGTYKFEIQDADKRIAKVRIDAAIAKLEKEDPVVYMNMGIPVTKTQIESALRLGRSMAQKVPGYSRLELEVTQSVEQAIRAVAPETLGPNARSTAAILASNMAKQKHRESVQFLKSEPRRQFWNSRGDEAKKFLLAAERGIPFHDPMLNKAAEGYKSWARDIYESDQAKGIQYDPLDNYFYHITEDPKGSQTFLAKKYGPQWGDPRFMKDRSARYIDDLEKAGFKLKTYNPEELMQMRQHASDIAHMKIDALRDMEQYGMARRVRKGDTAQPDEFVWRSPNGEIYALVDEANQIFHNAFNTKSLWEAKGVAGATFRAVMLAKNLMVPFKLASLFHPVHVQTMTAADALTSMTKSLAAGKMSSGKYALEAAGQMFFKDAYKDVVGQVQKRLGREPTVTGPAMRGNRSANIWRGHIPEAQLTSFERKQLQYQLEGGFIPELSPEFKAQALRRFKDAINQRRVVGAAFWMPFAALEKVYTRPIFEVWIPALKTYAYDTAARRALESDVSLLENPLKRMETFRKIQKSVDNRFGEMTYSTTFMNKTVKDVGVGSLLSLGWQLGFLREYGGAAAEVIKGGKISKTQLDKALFVGFYTTQALMLGGLMTYALTGQVPTSLLDYVYPKNGEKNPDGSDARVSTPYYTREFASIAYHSRNEGMLSGLGIAASNKVSPAIGVIKAWATNLDYFGNEISDPNSNLMTSLGQKLKYTLGDMEPVASASVRRAGEVTPKGVGLAVSGFSPAPRYVTENEVEGKIKHLYRQYYKSASTPFEKAEYSQEVSELRKAKQAGNEDKYYKLLDQIEEKYDLSAKQGRELEKGLDTEATVKMFQRFSANQQKRLLDSMSAEDREKYLAYAKKKLRYGYEAP